MVTVSVGELTGAGLDWAVAISELQNPFILENGAIAGRYMDGGCVVGYFPSTDWSQGGPLIDEYAIGFWGVPIKCGKGEWEAQMCHDDTPHTGRGENHKVAICRAIVAAKFGNTVDIPQELLE